MKKKDLKEILAKTDFDSLVQWIFDYSQMNAGFEILLRARFDPEKIRVETAKDYPTIIRAAFHNNPLKSYGRYRRWDEYGFDAENVRADLEVVLEDADYFLKNNNTRVAVEICKSMVEIIPEEWEEALDHEGDVQVMYDGAIDKLEIMLSNKLLPENEKAKLFEWYEKESKIMGKHKYIGLNTSFNVLQRYFLSSEDMIEKNLKSLNEKILNTSEEFYKGQFVIEKIEILEKVDRLDEMQQTIDEYIEFPEVRRIRLKSLILKKEYALAVELIREGIAAAEKKGHIGTIIDWKGELLKVVQYQDDKTKILQLAEDLLYNGREQKKYYDILKAETPKENWDTTLARILSSMKSEKGFWGFNHFRAEILVEHKKWDELYVQCKKGGVDYLEQYEKYLRPEFDREIYEIYLKFIEQQATITDSKAYANVSRFLKRLKTFSGGQEKVKELITKYREVYKRRKNMMKELEDII
ncbi:MAG: hypothetical protein WCR58_06890 [Bacteroidales bacterium]|jgi:hypothetical protein|nr:hypothetical protein [Bacteroidales bacterium]MDD3702011.1 hypothetical protein [Bacteroidales bacterium]MDY0369001.1 hypothetical protein [Bacteroidales bacterium]